MISKKALLFVNGEPPNDYPDNLNDYTYIACTDGAYHNYVCRSAIVPDFIIGDLDSWQENVATPESIQIIHTPDQNKTDFEKAILYLANKGINEFTIYGASGHSSDHFLGNLSVAIQYYQQYKFMFYDNYCHFFFANKHEMIKGVKDKTISLMPLSSVTHLTLTGFQYALIDKTLELGGLTSLRNKAMTDEVEVTYQDGCLLIFISDLAR